MGIINDSAAGGGSVNPSGDVLADQLLDDAGILLAASLYIEIKVEELSAEQASSDEMNLSERFAIVADELSTLQGISDEAETLADELKAKAVISDDDLVAAKAIVTRGRVSFAAANRALPEGERATEPELTLV